MFPRGPVFFFSQVYAFDTHVVVYYALLILVVALEFNASDRASARWYYYVQGVLVWSGALFGLGTWTQDGHHYGGKSHRVAATPLVTCHLPVLALRDAGIDRGKAGRDRRSRIWCGNSSTGSATPALSISVWSSDWILGVSLYAGRRARYGQRRLRCQLGHCGAIRDIAWSDAVARGFCLSIADYLLSVVCLRPDGRLQPARLHPLVDRRGGRAAGIGPGVLLPLLTVTVLRRLRLPP